MDVAGGRGEDKREEEGNGQEGKESVGRVDGPSWIRLVCGTSLTTTDVATDQRGTGYPSHQPHPTGMARIGPHAEVLFPPECTLPGGLCQVNRSAT